MSGLAILERQERIRRLRRQGLTTVKVAERVGCDPSYVSAVYCERIRPRVPVAPLRDAFLRSGLTASVLASRLGWFERDRPDVTRLKRALGLRCDGHGTVQETVLLRTALRLAIALGIDPVDIDV